MLSSSSIHKSSRKKSYNQRLLELNHRKPMLLISQMPLKKLRSQKL